MVIITEANTMNTQETRRPIGLGEIVNALTGGKRLIDINRNGIGVNLLGFHAGIGVEAGGQDGNATGGLSANVSTPWGSSAAAGMRGNAGSGGLGGGLYANATAIPGVDVSAGLGGNVDKESAAGGLSASARTPVTGERVSGINGQLRMPRDN